MPVGLLACSILLVNNLRDVDSDQATGKRTLAVRVGPAAAVRLYQASVIVSSAAWPRRPEAWCWPPAPPWPSPPLRAVQVGQPAPVLVATLVATATLQLVLSVLLAG